MAAGSLTSRLRRFIADHGSRWARRRQGLDVLPLGLTARRIYIVPTRAGLGLGALLLAMLGAGLNYNNSLALLLTFTLTGYVLVGMHQCHRRLLTLQLREVTASPAFVGDSLQLTMQLSQPHAAQAADLEALLQENGRTVASASASGTGGAAQILLRWPAGPRGLWRLGAVSLRTRAPAGLFRAWVWLHLDVTAVVYPQPGGSRELPQARGEIPGEHGAGSGLEELTSLRAFRAGDSPRQVAWKAYARGAPLLVKEYQGYSGQEHEFDFGTLGNLGLEARLSQLCDWVLAAERRGERYALKLPGEHYPADTGPQHLRECLTALALYGLPAQAPR